MSFFYDNDKEFAENVTKYVYFKQKSPEHRKFTDWFFTICQPSEEQIQNFPGEIPEGFPVINVHVNIISILAMALCRRYDSCQAIKELYKQHEELMLQIASKSPIVQSLGITKFMLPGETINYYKMALCLLEACSDFETNNDKEIYQEVEKAESFFLLSPFLILASTCKVEVEEATKKSIEKDLLRIAKKYNSRVVRKLKRTGMFNISESMMTVYERLDQAIQKDAIAPSFSRLALAEELVLSFFIGAGDMDIFIADIEEMKDAFFLGVTPLEASTDFVGTYLSNKKALKHKENRNILQSTINTYCEMLNDINCHSVSCLSDELLHISNCAIEQFLLPMETNLTDKDVRDILTILYNDETHIFANMDAEEQDLVVELSCYIVLVAKAYRRFAENYNEELNLSTLSKLHNISAQEEKYMNRISGLKSNIQNLNEKMDEKEKSAAATEETLKETIRRLEIENKRLQQQISSTENNTKELTALREYVYNQEEKEAEVTVTVTSEEMRAYLSSRKVTVIGGHPNWMNKLKDIFPSWEYIPIGINTFPKDKVSNSELVVIVANFCKHSMYYRAISAIETADVELMYLNGGNVELCIHNIYEHFTHV